MPQLFQPRVVSKEVITKDGECNIHITLDLNININAQGGVSVEAAANGQPKKEKNDDDEVQWQVPTFTSGQKVKFGKKE